MSNLFASDMMIMMPVSAAHHSHHDQWHIYCKIVIEIDSNGVKTLVNDWL